MGENFVHFSSANERLINFRYKLTQIQNYQSDLNPNSSIRSFNRSKCYICFKANIQQNIDTLIEKI